MAAISLVNLPIDEQTDDHRHYAVKTPSSLILNLRRSAGEQSVSVYLPVYVTREVIVVVWTPEIFAGRTGSERNMCKLGLPPVAQPTCGTKAKA